MKISRKHTSLSSKKDFAAVFDHARSTRAGFLLALYSRNNRSHARLAVIIKKTIIHNAVDRNRIRRVIRESFRYHQELLKGLDIVTVMRSECTAQATKVKPEEFAKKKNNTILRSDVNNLWQQILAALAKQG